MYIEPHNRDTRYDLWFVRYDITVPYIQTKSLDDLTENGLPTSGDAHFDHAMQWEPIRKSIPIHQMVDLWAGGASVKLVNHSDAPKIYHAITKHLLAWKEHIATSYNPNSPPYEDLLMLDQFAGTIYSNAKFTFETAFVNTHFKMNSSTAIGRRVMISTISAHQKAQEEKEAKGILPLSNIKLTVAQPKYDAKALEERPLIDYSGTERTSTAPQRESLASFFNPNRKR